MRQVVQQPFPIKALASLLGVTSNQVHMWHKRRHTTGFPDAIACTLVPQFPGDKRKTPLFDVGEVVDWYSTWHANKNRGSHWAEKRRKNGDHERPVRRGAGTSRR